MKVLKVLVAANDVIELPVHSFVLFPHHRHFELVEKDFCGGLRAEFQVCEEGRVAEQAILFQVLLTDCELAIG